MQISAEGLALIKQFEGFRSTVYPDIAGNPTIGYGHKLLPGELYPDGITEAQADALLLADTASAQHAVASFVTVPLTQGQYDALVDFTYNLGAGTLRGSTLLHLLNRKQYAAAAEQFPLWDHSGGRVVEGLETRREAEKVCFLKG